MSALAQKLSGLVALHIPISNGALQGADLPSRIKLLNWGENKSIKGSVFVGKKTLSSLSPNQTRLGFDRVGLDYNHQSLKGHENYKPDPREYAAYGVPKVIEGDGLWFEDLIWTPSGQVNAKNYIDLSPTPLLEDGEVVFLHSVALCPQGAVEGLSFYSSDFLNLKSNPQTTAMNQELKKLLCALFGVAETSDEAAILASGKTFADKLTAKPAPGMEALSADMKALGERLDNQERSGLVALAAQEGKVIPLTAEQINVTPITTLREMISKLPVTVPLEGRIPAGGVKELAATGFSASEKEVMKTLGISEESWKKYNS